MTRKLFFLGYMGCGKSTIGNLLSESLNLEFIDLDTLIEQAEGKTIKEIFEKEGEDYFRNLETKYIQNIGNKEDVVVSLGGGAPCFNNNMSLIKEQGVSFWLYIDPETIVDRLKKDTTRPLLQNMTEEELRIFVTEHSQAREVYYSEADYIIDASQNPEMIVKQIEKILG